MDGYLSIISNTTQELRISMMNKIMTIHAKSPSKSKTLFESVARVLPKLQKKTLVNSTEILLNFGIHNNNDGLLFINYVNQSISKFDKSIRLAIVEILINNYYDYFNNNIASLMEATDMFHDIARRISKDQKGFPEGYKEIPKDHQPKALEHFYLLYLENNRERERQIAQINADHQLKINTIDQSYNSNLNAIERAFDNTEFKKDTWRLQAAIGIAGGIGLIIIISNILVIFSIQRSVREIAERGS